MHHFPYLEKRARARANLIRQPPENSLVGRCCISDEKPRPFKIILALAGALSASMFWSCAYTSVSWLLSMGSVHLLQQNGMLVRFSKRTDCWCMFSLSIYNQTDTLFPYQRSMLWKHKQIMGRHHQLTGTVAENQN